MRYKIFKFNFVNDKDGNLIQTIEELSSEVLFKANDFPTQKSAFEYINKNIALFKFMELSVLPHLKVGNVEQKER